MTVTRQSPAAKPTALEYDYGVTPGEFLRKELAARGITQAEVAVRAGISSKHLNQVVQDVVPLSTDTALRLEMALGVSADLLGQLDAAHQASKSRSKAKAKLADYRDWFAEFPHSELVAHKIVTAKAAVDTQIEELLAFFGVAEPSAYEKVYADSLQSFRRAQHLPVNRHATSLWLRLVERNAEQLDVLPYQRSAFTSLLSELPALTNDAIGSSFPALQQRCASVGVAVIYTRSIHGTRASAAVRWLGPERPVIAVTDRGKYEDSLWFSFFHEAGHVVLHPKRKSVIEFEGDDDGDGAETQANEFAKNALLSGHTKQLSRLTTRDEVRKFAAELGLHPGIPAGIRAYDLGPAGFREFARLRRKLDDADLV